MAESDRLGDPCATRVGGSIAERLEVPRFNEAPQQEPIGYAPSKEEHPAITALKRDLSNAVYAAGEAADDLRARQNSQRWF